MNYKRPLIKGSEIVLVIMAIAGLLFSTSEAAQDYSSENMQKIGPSLNPYRHLTQNSHVPAIGYPENFPVFLAQSDSEQSNARDRWKNLSPEQKRKYREKLKRWKQLTPEQKTKIKNKYERFKNLPPEKRDRIRKNWKRYRQLDDRQRQAIRERHKRWKNLSDEQKQKIRERRRRYQNMTPEQRERLKQKRKKWQNLSPEKKQQLREKYHQRRLRDSDSSRRSKQNNRRGQKSGSRN